MNERRIVRSFVSYIDRSREYYAAQGYTQPYAWAYHNSVPFTPLLKPLFESRLGLVTTAGKIDGEAKNQDRWLYAMSAVAGRIGSVSPRFYGVPTDYSQKRTSLRNAPKILEWCREDGVDAVLLSAL